MIKPALRDLGCVETETIPGRSRPRPAPAVYVGAPSHAQAATPAMPPARQAAQLVSPLIRPGLLADRWFDTVFRRVSERRSVRAARFEYIERGFGEDLIAEIDPARLKRRLIDVVSDGRDHVRLSHWFLDGAEWTSALVPLEPSEVHLEMEAIFQPEDRLHQTVAYQQLLAVAALGRPQIHNGVRLATPELIRDYFQHYRTLRQSIEQHGFLPRQHVSREIAGAFASTSVRSGRAELKEREVSVAIAADGELVRIVGGHHRTAIAQRLGLRRMPVQIRLVHTQWLAQQVRRTRLAPAKALRAGIRDLKHAVWLLAVLCQRFVDEGGASAAAIL